MCWSGEASASLAVLGFTAAAFEFKKMKTFKQTLNDKYAFRGIFIFYIAMIELLQALTYASIGSAKLMAMYAFIAYLHACFQPLGMSLYYLSFIPKVRRDAWLKYVLALSLITIGLMLSRLVINPSLPGCFAKACVPMTNPLDALNPLAYLSLSPCCSPHVFNSYMGQWHIAWSWALNDCAFFFLSYQFMFWLLPLCYGCYRIVIVFFIFGPLLSLSLSNQLNEIAAIWCLIAIALVCSVKVPFLERFFTVRHTSWKSALAALKSAKHH